MQTQDGINRILVDSNRRILSQRDFQSGDVFPASDSVSLGTHHVGVEGLDIDVAYGAAGEGPHLGLVLEGCSHL